MKTMRTDGAMDYDMLGKISKVQLSVVEEFELAPFAPLCVEEGAGCFAGAEYRTDEDREALMGPLMASTAGVKKRWPAATPRTIRWFENRALTRSGHGRRPLP